MADEVQYSSAPDSNKRKYDDSPANPPPAPSSIGTRRSTGFSAPIIAPPATDAPARATSYNSVPPVDEIQLAKQKAQEIAARIFSSAEAKRPRVENGGGGFDDKGFSSGPIDLGQKPSFTGSQFGGPPAGMPISSYGYQGTSKKIDIPNGRVGVIIGKGGETIKYLQLQSGAKIQVTRDMDSDPNSATRLVELMGTPDQISKAEQLIKDVLSEVVAEGGGSGVVSRKITGQSGSEQFVMKVPNNKVGLIIGKGGETIKNMQARSGARIQVIPLHLPPGDTSMERTVQIDGTSEQLEIAKQLVNEVISSENRTRNPSMGGGYSQQGYQARPQTNWAQPGVTSMQQPGYGYAQPGAYPTPSPQYSQQAYAGYPQQASGGYTTTWDPTTGQPTQQTTQGGGYDYYGQTTQQQQAPASGAPAPATDNTGYNYNQQPASVYQQGYTQDGYGGYQTPAQPGYGQPQQNPIPGYDQQQGYNTQQGYGTAANPTQEGPTPAYGADPTQAPSTVQQGYNTTQQPSPNPSTYPTQGGTTQPGYGVPPTSQMGYAGQPPPQSPYGTSYAPPPGQKPVYGQAQQSPSAQGGYAQAAPVQPGYPHSQPQPTQTGHAQPDPTSQRAPPSGFSAAATQPGYGAPAYGAAQTGYGQQPPPYNSSYGTGYSQAPPYAAADANAPPATTQPGGVAKASPQS